MPTELMAPETATTPKPATQPSPQPRDDRNEPSVRELITSARSKPARPPGKTAWLLGIATGLLYWASFTPLDFAPLAWISLVPLLLLVRIPERTNWMYVAVTCTGLATMIACLQWLRLGDAAMYPAWFALGSYCGLYFPVFLWLSRIAVHRFRLPLAAAVPIVWTGLEYARAHIFSGFAWYFLGHTQYRWLELIQVSDLVGAYGVSFLVALAAAVIAGIIPRSVFEKLRLVKPNSEAVTNIPTGITRRNKFAIATCLALFAASLSYGYVRRSQAEFTAGPRVALVQGNFISSMKHDPKQALRLFQVHKTLTDVATWHQPDFIVWPETMHRSPLYIVGDDVTDEDLARMHNSERAPKHIRDWADKLPNLLDGLSRQPDAAMVIGLESYVYEPMRARHYNSAAFITPRRGYVNRYDKMHRVPFGEFVPMKEQFPWLLKLTPFPDGFGVDAGERAAVFEYKGYRGTPIICFEDTVPQVVRRVLNASAKADEQGRPADFLINLTNDGWFHGSSELDQHLITAAFRSVEYRTPTVRAVNTGISAIVDGDGAVTEPEVMLEYLGNDEKTGRPILEERSMRNANGRWNKAMHAVLVHNVPLDNRASLYLWWGDWFAGLCAAFCFAAFLGGIIFRRRDRRDRRNAGRELYDAAVAGA